MKIDLPVEILGRQIPVIPLFLRVMMFMFPIASLSGFITSFFDTTTGILFSLVLFSIFLLTTFLTIVAWKYSISFSTEGFHRGTFQKIETKWSEFTEVLHTTENNGLSTLYLRNKKGKQDAVSLPVKFGGKLIEELQQQLEQEIYGAHLKIEEFKASIWPKWTQILTQRIMFGILIWGSYIKANGIGFSPKISDFLDNNFALSLVIMMISLSIIMPLILLPMMSILSGRLEVNSSRLKFSPVWGTKRNDFIWDEIESMSEVINNNYFGLSCRSVSVKTKEKSTILRILNPKGFSKLYELVDSYKSQKQS